MCLSSPRSKTKNPNKLIFSLSPAARGPLFRREITGDSAEGRGMNPFDIQLLSDWDGRDDRGRFGRFPLVSCDVKLGEGEEG